MNSESTLKVYDILGYKVKLLDNQSNDDGEKAVELLRNELKLIEGKQGSVTEKILVAALKIAADRIKLQEFFNKELNKLDDLLLQVEDVSGCPKN